MGKGIGLNGNIGGEFNGILTLKSLDTYSAWTDLFVVVF